MLEKMKMIWQDAKQLKDERGLTLVELLVVVVILGIIAAIAVVAIGGIIENSKKDAMVADAKQMVSSAKLYTASNPVKAGESVELVFVGTETKDATKADGSKYISNLQDPFGENYTTALVKITEGGGNYTYATTLVGSKFKFENKGEKALTKDSTNLAPVTKP
ncbi:prepilin-type N-terminal cleavage/methylation domain-containing protein [Exiguobacterium sp. AM39-5BH]|uniref:prepilin-type N-terminal cleavage/methylation domain-containing protein n=1 Tax=Exiguobacterium sp. AM39-5BH TaxID=2292355 RepID=UPI000FE1A8D7|nr:prepilin-type N-terminal cleavage/methylation domain-containing protein [Exiguobacterium sp. AM39-5BH]RHB50546.1 prepilin-type N-terminal cleavage/methylation domain-containing protein [Exiguobacterium sp. AM39-5BH]